MQKWEYTFFCHYIEDNFKPSTFWNKKDNNGKADLDYIEEMGEEGWELVSTTPYITNGNTQQFLFMFKRPIP